MASGGSVLGVIPVRLASTRFPEKALASLDGRPLVLHVLERCMEAQSLDKVVVATDHERIARVVEAWGGTVCMTSKHHRCGTDRVWEVASKGEWSSVVNIQGDQPLVSPSTIDSCVEALSMKGVDMATAALK